MLFDSRASLAAEASLDSLWLKAQVTLNNIANSDTPGFKSSKVSFSQVLKDTQASKNNGSAARGAGAVYQTRVTTSDETTVRVDGNNVDMEKELAELWKTQAQYSYLLDKVKGHYNSINSAISNMRT